MLHDLKHAFRQLGKSPGYTAVVVLTLAFGLAVNTQIFNMVRVMFLRQMAVRDAHRLAVVVERSDLINLPHGLSFPAFDDLRKSSETLTDFVAFFTNPAHLSVPGQTPERGWIEAVTPDAFARLGVTTILGRPLQATDGERPPGAPVAVLTERFWERRFGRDPGVIGRTILINAKPFTIVGVVARGFESFSASLAVQAFVPSGALAQLKSGGEVLFQLRGIPVWRVYGYLRTGATMADANAELAVFAARLQKEFPKEHRNVRFQAVPEMRSRPEPTLLDLAPVFAAVFVGLVTLVLLIACANVANLMGARAMDRQKELVVRAALGASRFRLIRQLLVESVLMALIAGFAGFLLAWWGGDLLAQLLPAGDVPVRTDSEVGWQTWAFTVGMSLIAGVGSGLLPALRASRIDLNETLKQGGRLATSADRHRLRNILVIGQVAISCVVLVAAALFLRGLNVARQLNLGFRPERLLLLSFDLGMQGYDEDKGMRFQKQLLERVRTLPGVEAASITRQVPFAYGLILSDAYPDNSPARLVDGHATVTQTFADAEYLHAMGIPLLRGRDLLPTDDKRSPNVAVINEAMAKAFWPGMNPIGQHFRRFNREMPPIEVVGVIPTGKYVMLSEEPRPYFIAPIAQGYDAPVTLVVRTRTDPHGMVRGVSEAVRALDPDLPTYSVSTMDEHLNSSAFAFMPLRGGAAFAAVQGSIALVLAVMGLYAVVAYGVTARTREIGVRMALGATQTDVVKLVSRDGLLLTLKGLAIGLMLSVLVAVGLSRVLYGVSPADPLLLPAVVLVLAGTATLACYLPARRAGAVDPNQALRVE